MIADEIGGQSPVHGKLRCLISTLADGAGPELDLMLILRVFNRIFERFEPVYGSRFNSSPAVKRLHVGVIHDRRASTNYAKQKRRAIY